MLHTVYEAAACPKEKLVILGAGHAESYVVSSKWYWDSVFRFIENYLE